MTRKLKENDIIIVRRGMIARIAQDVGISTESVRKCLRGICITSKENYDIIRKRAMDFYDGRILI